MMTEQVPAIGPSMGRWCRRNYGTNAAKRVQADIDVSETTSERILAGAGSINNWIALAHVHGWQFVHETLDAVCGPYDPAETERRLNTVLTEILALKESIHAQAARSAGERSPMVRRAPGFRGRVAALGAKLMGRV